MEIIILPNNKKILYDCIIYLQCLYCKEKLSKEFYCKCCDIEYRLPIALNIEQIRKEYKKDNGEYLRKNFIER